MRLRKQQRVLLVVVILLLVGGAAALALTALRDNVAFFVTPSEMARGSLDPGRSFRRGGGQSMRHRGDRDRRRADDEGGDERGEESHAAPRSDVRKTMAGRLRQVTSRQCPEA